MKNLVPIEMPTCDCEHTLSLSLSLSEVIPIGFPWNSHSTLSVPKSHVPQCAPLVEGVCIGHLTWNSYTVWWLNLLWNSGNWISVATLPPLFSLSRSLSLSLSVPLSYSLAPSLPLSLHGTTIPLKYVFHDPNQCLLWGFVNSMLIVILYIVHSLVITDSFCTLQFPGLVIGSPCSYMSVYG